jgi:putative aldouronate transport system substrate-binding protein
MDGQNWSMNRRTFLRVTGGALTVSLASACVPNALTASPTRAPATGPTAGAQANAIFPTYRPLTNALKADFPAEGPQYDDGFNSFPSNPVKALPADPPGTGSKVKVMSIALFPPSTPMESNPAWQAVNKAPNATMQIEVVTQADYPVKLGTIMSGSDPPDMMYIYARTGSSSTLAAATAMPQFLQSQAADLTPYLAGDAAKDYPNLAAIPTTAWKNAGCADQGHLYLVPLHRYLPGSMWVKNVNAWDQTPGKDYVPKNADDFKRALQALTNPQLGFYGIVGAQDSVMQMATFASIFGAPNGWRLERGGELVKDIETPEYREALGYARDL